MIELDCPWCDEPVRLNLAALTETATFRCETCRIAVEVGEPDVRPSLALAA